MSVLRSSMLGQEDVNKLRRQGMIVVGHRLDMAVNFGRPSVRFGRVPVRRARSLDFEPHDANSDNEEFVDGDAIQDLRVELWSIGYLDDVSASDCSCEGADTCVNCLLRDVEKEYGHKPLPSQSIDDALAGRRLRQSCPA